MRAFPSYLLLRGLGSFAGACAFTLNLVYQVETVGLGPLQLVTVGTALEVVCFLAQAPTGIVSARRSPAAPSCPSSVRSSASGPPCSPRASRWRCRCWSAAAAGCCSRQCWPPACRSITSCAPVLLALVGAVFFLGLGSEGWDRLSPAHFLDDLAFPALGPPVLWFGAMSAAALLGAVLLTEAVRRRVDATRPRQVGLLLVGFELGRVLATVVFALAGGFWWAAGAWLVSGLLRSAAAPLLETWLVAATEPASRATVLSVTAQVDAAGQVLGGPPVGVLGEWASVRTALLGTGLPAVPAVLLLTRAASRSRATVRAAG